MKLATAILGVLLTVQVISGAVVPRDNDYADLANLLTQAGETAKAGLAAAASDRTERAADGKCTLSNLSIRREWSVQVTSRL